MNSETRPMVLKPQSWWADLVNNIVADPDLSQGELAVRVGKTRVSVNRVMQTPEFQTMLEDARKALGKLPAAQNAIVALANGIKFKHTAGELENQFQVSIMAALLDETEKPVYGKDGIIGHEPTVSLLEKAKLAMEGFKVLNQKAAQIIGKQVNIDKSTNLNVTAFEMLSPALQELAKVTVMHIPTRKIEHKDGSTEFVMDDVNTVQPDDLEEGEEEEE